MPSPTVAAYLERLPRGPTSYPDVLVKAAVLRSSLESLPDGKLPVVGIPEIDAVFREPPPLSQWVPQVYHCVLLAAIFDESFGRTGGRTEFDQWVLARNRELFRGRLYRVLFALSGPDRVLAGYANRWRAFRRGVDVEMLSPKPKQAQARLTYPPHLMEELTLRGLRMAFRAAVEACGTRGAVVQFTERGPTETLFLAQWR